MSYDVYPLSGSTTVADFWWDASQQASVTDGLLDRKGTGTTMSFGGGAHVVSEGLNNMVKLPDDTGFAEVQLSEGVVSPHMLMVVKLSARLEQDHLDTSAEWF